MFKKNKYLSNFFYIAIALTTVNLKLQASPNVPLALIRQPFVGKIRAFLGMNKMAPAIQNAVVGGRFTGFYIDHLSKIREPILDFKPDPLEVNGGLRIDYKAPLREELDPYTFTTGRSNKLHENVTIIIDGIAYKEDSDSEILFTRMLHTLTMEQSQKLLRDYYTQLFETSILLEHNEPHVFVTLNPGQSTFGNNLIDSYNILMEVYEGYQDRDIQLVCNLNSAEDMNILSPHENAPSPIDVIDLESALLWDGVKP